jgi:hypothetical protein
MDRSPALPNRLASLLLAFLVAAALATTVASCGGGSSNNNNNNNGLGGASISSLVIERLGSNSGVDKIDLVLVVANSPQMADKQYVLSLAIPDLVDGLVNPPCLDDKTHQPVASQPTGPTQACPAGSTRASPPVQDIHIGVLSSSLGTFGADGCPEKPPAACTGATPNSISNDDHGHLVTRTDPCGTAAVPTYQNLGFLQWDPAQKLTPPGIQMASALQMSVNSLVLGDGQDGCGFASQDEAWYRFLVDPTPYQSIALVNNQVQVQGTDQNLLAQRKEFLRPDSLLYIVEVSDTTDGSLKEYSSYPLFAAPELHLPHPSSACNAGSPNPTPKDPCCYSCGQNKPNGCTADPACTSSPSYTAADENTALRAFGLTSHKARYGIEFFYPPSRYVSALKSPTVPDVNNKMVPNPIYSNLDPAHYKGAVRSPSLVLYAAIAGVPWQLIARQNAQGAPDLVNGVSALDPTQVGGFKTATELNLNDKFGNVFWDDIAGDPENYVNPRSPFMVESTVPRTGTDPITGAMISPATTANGSGSSVGGSLLNDHERTIADPPDDIEYACVFDLPAGHTRDCTQPGVVCDCPSSSGTATDNPLCQGTTQVKAKAYPGLKELAIARGMGKQGVAASICPKQLTDPTASDYGYRPAVKAILGPLKSFAKSASCVPEAPLLGPGGQAECFFIEARNASGAACSCDPAQARAPVATAHLPAELAIQQDPLDLTDHWNCFCEIEQLSGGALAACQTNQPPPGTANGWCFAPSAEAVADGCPAGEEAIRFLGTSAPLSGGTVFITCLVQ